MGWSSARFHNPDFKGFFHADLPTNHGLQDEGIGY